MKTLLKNSIGLLLLFSPLYVYAQDAKTYYNKALTYYDQTNYGYAIEALTKAIQLKPDYYDAYVKRAECNNIIEQFDAAIADYKAAEKLYPNSYDLYYRASVYDRQGKYDLSIADLTSILNTEKTSSLAAQACYKRGLVYLKMGKYPEAATDTSRVNDIAKTWVRLYDNATRLKTLKYKQYMNDIKTARVGRGNYSNSLIAALSYSSYCDAIKDNPYFADAYFERGLLLWSDGKKMMH